MHLDNHLTNVRMKSILTLDIAHPPLRGAEAEAMLDQTFRSARLSSSIKIIKVIHGYGSSGKGGTLKTLVRNWGFTNRHRIKVAIEGENLSPFNPQVQTLVVECNLNSSQDLGIPSEGFTIFRIQ